MLRLFNRHPLVVFLLIGVLMGSFTALFFNPDIRWALLASSALTGLVTGFVFQQVRRQPQPRLTPVNHVTSHIQPELKPLPEPVTSLFLYNTLHNIAALILFDTIRASEAVENLANFVRTISELKRAKQTFLGEEFKAIDLYLNIEKSRLGDRLVFTKQFAQECFEIPFPSLALFPFIDGCIRFGAELQMNPVTVMVGCRQENGHVIIEFADHVDEEDGETWETASRDKIFDQVKKRLVDFYGSAIKVTRQRMEPIGEHITVLIPLTNAMIGRYSNQDAAQKASL